MERIWYQSNLNLILARPGRTRYKKGPPFLLPTTIIPPTKQTRFAFSSGFSN